MKYEIDIYDCPQKPSLEYMIAVMQAASVGRPVQYSIMPGAWNGIAWPSWDWANRYYRIDPASRPKIAEGHNPDRLTEDQVGVKDGWRLLTQAEINARGKVPYTRGSTGICYWRRWSWSGDDMHGDREEETYRTKKPAGYFLQTHKTLTGVLFPERLTLVSEDGGKTWRLA